MDFISTRGQAAPQAFADVLLAGPASDGGLFLPSAWPVLEKAEIAALAQRSYGEAAFAILSRFTDGSFSPDALRADIEAAYAGFETPAIAPLVPLGQGLHLLELFHGPTLAFKDVAMQLLGRMFARALAERGRRATVVAATSGDTGSAAIAALGGMPNLDVFVLHPKGRVSEVQRLQMTTAPFGNVHNIALEGSFDDAQAIVKALFADTTFANDVNLTAVNSINFVRIAAQIVYYFTAAATLDAPPIFVVPTGNFGDVFAGEAAMRMGLAAERLVVATNQNDILARALNRGVYETGEVHATLSPSMDIQVASNFERALFEASGRDADWLRGAMADFARTRRLVLPDPVRQSLAARYAASRSDDAETLATIARIYRDCGRLIDPHTAVAMTAAEAYRGGDAPVVVLSTAHPAKFPDAVRRATGQVPPLPPRLKGLYDGVERVQTLPNNLEQVRTFIASRLDR
ncbi:MAG: threonine synthase [Alphaproteobacteria bacterium]|nr:threonine synthase [Alphaproteobacteria bacterium]